MVKKRHGDAVDAVLDQWRRERPDIDVGPMGTIGRLKRCAALIQRSLNETFSTFGMTSWEFDVLATLRRSGDPFRLAPTALYSSLMLTSGTMTRQLRELENRGLVCRLPNPNDARSMLVQLTPEGRELIDRAVEAHVEKERCILASLEFADGAALDTGLAGLLSVLECVDN